MTTTAPLTPDLLRTELLDRARGLVTTLKGRAPAAEQAGHIPEQTVADLREAGLLRAATPAAHGGYDGVDYDLSLEIAAELARGCASTAWCYSVWMSHNWMMGNAGERAQADYFATGPDVLSSTASSPKRTDIDFTDTGFELSGHWGFASGSYHSQWFLMGPQEMLAALMVPRADVEILDTWRSPGLRGTGTHEIVVKSSSVPAHRVWTPLDDGGPGGPIGWAVHGRASYRVAMWMFTYTIVAPMVGAARSGVDSFVEKYAGTSLRPGAPRTTRHAGSEALHLAIAESAAEVDVAELLWRTDLRAVLDQAAAGVPFDLERRAAVRRNQAYAAKLAVRAVNRLFEFTGAHALTEDDQLQRAFRDLHAASHHVTVPYEFTMADYGSVIMQQPFAMEFQRDGIDPTLVARP